MIADSAGSVQEIKVKQPNPGSDWVWGAFKLSGRALHDLCDLWHEPGRGDEYIGTLVNAYLARGGHATAVKAGTAYVDVGTVRGYRAAINLLSTPAGQTATAQQAHVAPRRT